MTSPLVVIGFGNRLRGDDGAGLVVAEHLRGRLPAATVLELETVPLDLFTRWTAESEVVLVDAALGGSAPGTVHRFDAREEPLPAELFRLSTHAGGLAEAVELARALSCLPARLVVFAIEGATFEHGARISEAVARAVLRVASCVSAECGWRHA